MRDTTAVVSFLPSPAPSSNTDTPRRKWSKGRALLQVGVVFVGQGRGGRGVELLLVLRHEVGVDLDFGRGEGRGGDEFECGRAVRHAMYWISTAGEQIGEDERTR